MSIKIQSPIFIKSDAVILHHDGGGGWFNVDGPLCIISMNDIYTIEKQEEFKNKLSQIYKEYSKPTHLKSITSLI